jgi:hypothetical protein
MKKDLRINVRINEILKERIREAKRKTGIPETLVVTSCLEAYCAYVEQNDEFTFPLAVLPLNALPDNVRAGYSNPTPPIPTKIPLPKEHNNEEYEKATEALRGLQAELQSSPAARDAQKAAALEKIERINRLRPVQSATPAAAAPPPPPRGTTPAPR